MSPHPSPVPVRDGYFVLRPMTGTAERERALKRLADHAQVEVLNSRTPGWIVALAALSGSPEVDWDGLRERLGDDYQILPVLRNEGGSDRYPTGVLSLRIRNTLDPAELGAIATEYGLELVRHTPLAPLQAQFKLLRPAAVFAPALVARLEQDLRIEAAWLDADSAFVRLGK